MNGRQSPTVCGVTRTNHILRRLSALGSFGGGASSVHGTTPNSDTNGFSEFALALRQSSNQTDENSSHAALHQLVTGSRSVALIFNSTRSPHKYHLSTDATNKRMNSNSIRINKNPSRRLYRRSRQSRLGRTKPTPLYAGLVSHCFLGFGLGCTRRLDRYKSSRRHSKKRANIQCEASKATKQPRNCLPVHRNTDCSMSNLMDITSTSTTSNLVGTLPLKTTQCDKVQRLPLELVVAILSRLYRPKDIRAAQLTCRLWHDAAKTALVNLRRRFPYAGMSILESLRTCINGMPRPSAHDVTFRRMVSQLGSDYVLCNPDIVAAFHPIDPLAFIYPLIWTFLFIDREHHGLLANNNNATTIHHVTTHAQPAPFISQVFRWPSFLTRSSDSSTSNPNEHTLNCRHFVRLVRKEYPCGRGLDKQALKVNLIITLFIDNDDLCNYI